MTLHTWRLCWRQFGIVGLLIPLFVCACQVPILPSDGEQIGAQTDPTQPSFVLLLYPNGTFDPEIDEDGLQQGLEDAASSSPFDTLTEVELVGANWTERTLVFGSTVRQRYDDSGNLSLPICQFVLQFKGQVLFGGDVENSFSARAIRYPVAIYDVLESRTGSKDTLTLTLMSRLGYGFSNGMAPFPGLTSGSDEEIGRYLSDTVSRTGP